MSWMAGWEEIMAGDEAFRVVGGWSWSLIHERLQPLLVHLFQIRVKTALDQRAQRSEFDSSSST
jgi:hypothetical protein